MLKKKLSFNISFFVTFRNVHIVSIVYINYNLEKHLIGKTRFTELKLPRTRIRTRIRIRIRNHRNRIRIKIKQLNTAN